MSAVFGAAALDQVFKLLNSTAGQAAFLKLMTDHGITADKLDQVVKSLPVPPPPKEK